MGWKSIALGVAGLMLATQPAFADTQTFTLALTDAAGLGAGPFGTVTVTENAGGTLTFSQTLFAGFRIHETNNANHQAFYFSIIGDPAVTISGLTAGFAAVSTSAGSNVPAPSFANFYTAIACTTACGPGYGGGFAGTLSFTVAASSALTLTSLRSTAFGGNSVYFATDIVRDVRENNTGNVGAVRQTGAVPEPATWGMMLVGFAGIGVSLRRRRRADALAAA